MSNITVRLVTDIADKKSIDAAVYALGKSFYHPVFDPVIDHDATNIDRYFRAHCMTALISGGEMLVAELPGAGIVGAALWYPPGTKFLLTEEQQNAGFKQFLEGLSPVAREWWVGYRRRSDEGAIKYFGPGGKVDPYHLQIVGVLSQHQQKGIGKALMKHGHDKARELGVPCALETTGELNASIYKKCGYEIVGSEVVDFVPGGSTDLQWMMRHNID